MAETLKVIFQADDKELQAALQRSSSRIADFDKRFARRRDALPIASSSFTGWEQAAAKATRSTQALEQAAYRAGKGGMAGSFGFLAFSQAVEDAQYGMRGVLNNIPQMVIGFGGGVGLAGAISLAAVAASQAIPIFLKLADIEGAEKMAKAYTDAGKAMTDSFAAARAEAEALAKAREEASKRAAITERAAIQREALGIDSSRLSELERAAAAAERIREADAAVAAVATSTFGPAKDGRQLGQQLTDRARVEFTERQRKLTGELAAAQEQLNFASAEYERIWKGIRDQTGDLTYIKMEAEKGANTIRQTVTDLQAQLAAAEVLAAGLPDGKAKDAAQTESTELRAKLTIQKALLDEREKEAALYDDLITAARSEGRASLKELDAKRAGLRDNIAGLRDTIKAQMDLAAVTKDSIALQALRKQEETTTTARDEAASRAEALTTLQDELAVLRARSQEGEKYAEDLQREIDLRREAAKLAEDTGLDPGQAKAFLRQKLDLEKQAAERARQATGTISERRQARSEERAAERQRARNERVAEARRKREEKNQRDNDSKLNPKRDDAKEQQRQKELEDARRKANDDRNKANDNLGKNVAEQLDIQKKIQETIAKITSA